MGIVRWTTIVLAGAGVAVAAWAVATSDKPPPPVPPSRPPSVNPFGQGVAALGVVEPRTRIMNVMAPESALVVEVLVEVGAEVEPGDALFRLDSRPLQADLLRAEAAVEVGVATLARLRAQPRPEDVVPLQAAADKAKTLMANREEEFRRVSEAGEQGAATDWDSVRRRFDVDEARAAFAEAAADLQRVRAGAWSQDLDIAARELELLRAEADAIRILIERMTVRAPAPGTILRRSIEPGEMASVDRGRPALLLGDLSRPVVRAQVDEEDIPFVRSHQRAVARLRGSAASPIALTFIRVEPYAAPKTQLGNSNAERVDTRVVDVLFEVVMPVATPLYPGQAVDVFIDTSETQVSPPPAGS